MHGLFKRKISNSIFYFIFLEKIKLFMLAKLDQITEELTGNKALADVLEKNFVALNNMAEQREGTIISAINEMKRALSKQLNEKIDGLGIKSVKEDVGLLKEDLGLLLSNALSADQKLDAIIKYLNKED